MTIAQLITLQIDVFYFRQLAAVVPRQTFRYAACGVLTMVLDIFWYFVFYNFIFCRENFDLGLLVISPHVAALILVFPITFFTGFWLNSHVAFRSSSLKTQTQLLRYALSVGGSLLLTYICIKIFVDVCGVWPTPSKIMTNVVTVTYSYLMAKYFTFRNSAQD